MRRAIDGGEYQPLAEYLSGPTALTFVQGDVSAVAKALRDFARANPLLVIKGGLADGSLLSSSDLAALADLPPRDVLLARIAGALAAPMQQMAGLLQALPRNLAYGISALIEQREAGGETLAGAEPERQRRRAEAPAPRPRRTPLQRRLPAEASRAEAAEDAGRPPPSSPRRPPRRRQPRHADAEATRRGATDGEAPDRQQIRSTAKITDKTEGKKGRPSRWQGP